MKNLKKAISITLLLIFACTSVLQGCGKRNDKDYEIKYYLTATELWKTIPANAGDEITAPDNPTRNGYTFRDWYTSLEFSGKFVTPSIMPAENLTAYARWIKEEASTITFDSKGGSTIEPYIGFGGDDLDLSLFAPTKVDYEFKGWFIDSELSTAYSSRFMPESDITLFAKWEALDITMVNFILPGGVDSVRVDKGDRVTAPDIDSLSEYEILGWKKPDGSEFNFDEPITESINITLECYSKGITFSQSAITDYRGKGTVVIVPAEYNGYTINTVGNGFHSAFYSSTASITKIVLPQTIQTIKNYAFDGLASLIELNIPTGVTSIGSSVFNECNKLSVITFEGNESYPVEGGAIYNFDKSKLIRYIGAATEETFTVPSSVTTIDPHAFTGAFIGKVIINNTVSTLSKKAFKASAVKIVEITPGFTRLDDNVFENSVLLENVILRAGIIDIGKNTFAGCSSLASITLPASLKSIGSFAFLDCISLGEIEFDRLTVTIGDGAFVGAGLTTAIISPGTVEIKARAYAGLTKITSVTIPASVKVIGEGAFAGCTDLAGLNFEDNSQLEIIGLYAFENTGLVTLDFSNLSKLSKIGRHAFRNCTQLISADMGETIDCFGWKGHAYTGSDIYSNGEWDYYGAIFAGCSNLADLTIPFVGSFSEEFRRAEVLPFLQNLYDEGRLNEAGTKYLTLASGSHEDYIKSCTYYANNRENCFGVLFGEVEYDGSVKGTQFYGIDGTKGDVYTTDGVVAENYRTFYFPTALKRVTVTGEYISASAFNNLSATNIEEIYMPNAKHIGSTAFMFFNFKNAPNLTDNIEVLGVKSFYALNQSTFTVPDSVKEIGGGFVAYSRTLEQVKLPDRDFFRLGDYAFNECSNLSKVYSSGTPEANTVKLSDCEIGYAAFANCTSIYYADIPDVTFGVMISGDDVSNPVSGAFSMCSSLRYATIPATIEVEFEHTDANKNTLSYNKSIVPAGLFAYCTSLVRVNSSVDGTFNAPAVESIGSQAFSTTPVITLNLDPAVKQINHQAFRSTKVRVISLPGVETINSSAFYDCSELEIVRVTDALRAIEWEAFRKCTVLDTMVVHDKNNFANTVPGKNTAGAINMPNSMIKLNYGVFRETSVSKINFSTNLEAIGAHVFWGCEGITEVEIPASVTTIDSAAFRATGLSKVSFAEGSKLKTIVAYAFCELPNIRTFTVPEGVRFIGSFFLSDCANLEYVYIPSTVYNIVTGNFCSGSPKLREVYFAAAHPANVDGTVINEPSMFSDQKPSGTRVPTDFNKLATMNDGNGLQLYIPTGSESLYANHVSYFNHSLRPALGWYRYANFLNESNFTRFEGGVTYISGAEAVAFERPVVVGGDTYEAGVYKGQLKAGVPISVDAGGKLTLGATKFDPAGYVNKVFYDDSFGLYSDFELGLPEKFLTPDEFEKQKPKIAKVPEAANYNDISLRHFRPHLIMGLDGTAMIVTFALLSDNHLSSEYMVSVYAVHTTGRYTIDASGNVVLTFTGQNASDTGSENSKDFASPITFSFNLADSAVTAPTSLMYGLVKRNLEFQII